jgi:hypothetical protein
MSLESINTLSAHTVLTARAIDKMTLLVPQILQLSSQALQLLLLGGVELIAQLERHLLPSGKVETYLLPQSTARYLLEVDVSRETWPDGVNCGFT